MSYLLLLLHKCQVAQCHLWKQLISSFTCSTLCHQRLICQEKSFWIWRAEQEFVLGCIELHFPKLNWLIMRTLNLVCIPLCLETSCMMVICMELEIQVKCFDWYLHIWRKKFWNNFKHPSSSSCVSVKCLCLVKPWSPYMMYDIWFKTIGFQF